MPKWFKKVFQGGAARPAPKETPVIEPQPQTVASAPSLNNPALGPPDTSAYEHEPGRRRVVQAPILVPEGEQSSWSEEIRIKAQVQRDSLSCVFMVDRPIFDGYSAWFPHPTEVENISGLATRLFGVLGVGTVLLHGTTVSVTLSHENMRTWEELTADIGGVVREYLKSGEPVVSKAFMDAMPPEDEIRKKLQSVVDLEINPGIAAHTGVITLERIEGNTVYVTMGGGCQGCAASSITLKQGIHGAFREAMPQVGAIYDETDHAAGVNPYYSEVPAGMAEGT